MGRSRGGFGVGGLGSVVLACHQASRNQSSCRPSSSERTVAYSSFLLNKVNLQLAAAYFSPRMGSCSAYRKYIRKLIIFQQYAKRLNIFTPRVLPFI